MNAEDYAEDLRDWHAEDGAINDDPSATVKAVAWPVLSPVALHGNAGRIVNAVAPHTEADTSAVLLQLLAVFGATVPGPYFTVSNTPHRAIISPTIVGRTSDGAKGTSLSIVEAILRGALPDFSENMLSGLSTGEGLIEAVRDPSGNPEGPDYDQGMSDKRLVVVETEYRSVLSRSRREGNTLLPVLRQAWDGGTLRTMTRRKSRLTATAPHVVVVGHISPDEFRSALTESDLAGGNVNRLLLCLSRRTKLLHRLGNIPEDVISDASRIFRDAYEISSKRERVDFADDFWGVWEPVYRRLNRSRSESRLTSATNRGPVQVLRLSLLYALFDGSATIAAQHLRAAVALWDYCEASARWLFSSHEQEERDSESQRLAEFIKQGGPEGRTRTEIYRDHFGSNLRSEAVTSRLTPLVRDGVLVERKRTGGSKPVTTYVFHALLIDVFTDSAAQSDLADVPPTYSEPVVRTTYVNGTYPKTGSEQLITSIRPIRSARSIDDVDTSSGNEGDVADLHRLANNLCPVCGLDGTPPGRDLHFDCEIPVGSVGP